MTESFRYFGTALETAFSGILLVRKFTRVIDERQHRQDPDSVEHGVEYREFQGVVVAGDADPVADPVHCLRDLVDEDDGDERR